MKKIATFSNYQTRHVSRANARLAANGGVSKPETELSGVAIFRKIRFCVFCGQHTRRAA